VRILKSEYDMRSTRMMFVNSDKTVLAVFKRCINPPLLSRNSELRTGLIDIECFEFHIKMMIKLISSSLTTNVLDSFCEILNCDNNDHFV
jgi:hypothetical protein